MKLTDIAKLIPKKFRDLILETNLIYKAVALPTDPHMYQLMHIWDTYVEKQADMQCAVCIQNVLGNYRALEATLIEMYKNETLVDL